MKKVMPYIASMLLVSGCLGGPSATNSVTKAGEAKSGFMGLSRTDDITVTTADAFKGANDVVIGNFVVGFATYKTASAKAGGGLMGNGFGGKSTAKSTLNGIDDATMQQITDAAYNSFVADLKAKGYNVVDRNALMTHADFSGSKTYPNPYEDSAGGLFGTNSKTKYFAPTNFGGIKSFMGDIPGLSGGFAFDNPIHGAVKYAETSGKKVLSVVYVVDFANADSYGGYFRTSSSVSVGQGITIVPGSSKVSLYGGQGGTFSTNNGTIALGQPINSEKEFATVSDATSDASRGMEMAANVIGVLGGVGTNAKRDYEFNARPADYKLAVGDALKQANNALTSKMQSLR